MLIVELDLSKEINFMELLNEVIKIEYPIDLNIKNKLYEFINFPDYLSIELGDCPCPSARSPQQIIRDNMIHVLTKNELEMFYKMEDKNAAMRWVLHYFEEKYDEGNYELCDKFIQDINVFGIEPFLLVTILTVTSGVRNKLKQREYFFDRVKEEIIRVHGEERTERILVGLK